MQWLEFLYYIEPIIKASTERTKFGPLLWTKLKQQVLLTPLTQETLYYLSAFWWTRQLREVTGFSPSQEVFAVTFNPVCGKEKKATPPTPSHWSWMQMKESQQHWMNPTGRLLLLPACVFLSLTGDHLEKFKFFISPKFRKKVQHWSPLSPFTNSFFSVTVSFCLDNTKGKKTLFCSLIISIFYSSYPKD